MKLTELLQRQRRRPRRPLRPPSRLLLLRLHRRLPRRTSLRPPYLSKCLPLGVHHRWPQIR